MKPKWLKQEQLPQHSQTEKQEQEQQLEIMLVLYRDSTEDTFTLIGVAERIYFKRQLKQWLENTGLQK